MTEKQKPYVKIKLQVDLCPTCKKNPAVYDECPFDAEIYERHTTCGCCVECREECLQEI